ncbi:DUF4190 domain-containing protein [uncultured Nocardioides sp.]|uniref:DUF4190 domain-containing protein n=1 Tax=uncultured Nocardioides sp. TaxID=198441 RepID=UPI002603B2C3|nr:DUF4190 domain-containing protein [uncultured Nocardioides sp.]
MSDLDPSERWRELDASDRRSDRARDEPAPSSGPSPYESYPWGAVDGSPLPLSYPPFPAGPHRGPLSTPAAVPVQHPSASVALTLGVIGLAGGVLCYVPLLAAPVAVLTGRRVVREIDASGGALTGRGAAVAGLVLGSLGSAVLALLVAALVYWVASP